MCVDRNSHLLGVYCCLLQLSAHHCIIIYTVYFSFCFRFQFFIELSHIRKCFTQKGNVFVLEEFGKMICLFFVFCYLFNFRYCFKWLSNVVIISGAFAIQCSIWGLCWCVHVCNACLQSCQDYWITVKLPNNTLLFKENHST